MSGTQTIRGLAAKWRAIQFTANDDYLCGRAHMAETCADELDALADAIEASLPTTVDPHGARMIVCRAILGGKQS